MSKQANPTMIGAFGLGALALAVCAVVVLGGGALFKETRRRVLFFEGSLEGMRVGASVNFNGIPVGEVTDVGVLFERDSETIYTPIYIEIDPSRFRGADPNISKADSQKIVKHMIKRGLRATLSLETPRSGERMEWKTTRKQVHRRGYRA